LSVEENWNIIEAISSKGIYGYRFYPDKVKGEGFFIAAFKKQEGDERDFKSSSVQTISKNEMVVIKDWVKEDPSLSFLNRLIILLQYLSNGKMILHYYRRNYTYGKLVLQLVH
jgi:hypothetical protein